MTFHPMPRTYARMAQSGQAVLGDLVEVAIPNGKTCRYLALDHEIAPPILVHLVEGDAGLPGAFFEARPLGPTPELRGGYIGEHVGPKTLRFWLSSRANCPLVVGGALCFEDTESIEPEKEPSP